MSKKKRGASAAEVEPTTTKVLFNLEVEDGWPPVSGESLWATDLGNDLYRIDNVPWFAHDIAVGTVVRAIAPDAKSKPVFQEVVEPSDHSTIRLIVFAEGPLKSDLKKAMKPFTKLGVFAEGFAQFGMVALDVAPTAPLREVFELLRRGTDDGSWEYEEGYFTEAWQKVSGTSNETEKPKKEKQEQKPTPKRKRTDSTSKPPKKSEPKKPRRK